jgi:hypothetical protein
MSGDPGPQGHTGATGRKGLQGTPYGAPGTTFYSPSGRVVVLGVEAGGAGNNEATLIRAGSVFNITQVAGNPPLFVFPIDLTTDQFGTYWTLTNTIGANEQNIKIQNMYKLTIPGAVLTVGVGQQIDLSVYRGHSITFVYVAGSAGTAEYIAF